MEILKYIRWNGMIMAALTVAVGVALVINPGFATVSICLLIGWLLLVSGAVSIFLYLRGRRRNFGLGSMVLGVVELALGIFIVLRPEAVAEFLFILFAAILLVHGAVDVRDALAVRRYGDESWRVPAVLGGISILLGLLVLWNPFASASFVMTVIGLALIYDGVSDILILVRVGRFLGIYRRKEDGSDGDDLRV